MDGTSLPDNNNKITDIWDKNNRILLFDIIKMKFKRIINNNYYSKSD